MTNVDVEVHEGLDQIILTAERRGMKCAILVDGEAPVDDRDATAMFAEIGDELGQYAFPAGSMLHNRLKDERREEPELVTDGGVATGTADGSGYLGSFAPPTLTRLLVLSLLIHIPLDIVLTVSAWELEGNPLVLELGPITWVSIKLGLLVATVLVWYDSTRVSPDPYPLSLVTERLPFSDSGRPYPLIAAAWMGIFVGLGLALILPNVAILLAEVLA